MKKKSFVLVAAVLACSTLLSACGTNLSNSFSPQPVMSSQDMVHKYAQWLRKNQTPRPNMMAPTPGNQPRLPARLVEI